MKRIMIMIPSLKVGGQEKVAVDTAEILSQYYDVMLVVFTDNGAFFNPDCKVISLDLPANINIFYKIINVIKRTWRIKKIKKEYSIDVAYSFGASANIVNVLSKYREKCLIGIRSFMSLKGKYYFIYKHADLIITVSEAMTDFLIKKYPRLKNKIKTIYNAFDIDVIDRKVKESIEMDNKIFTIAAMGRLVKIKGFEHLIRAVAILNQRNNQVKLIIIGDGEEKRNLEEEAKKANISENVVITGYTKNPYKYLSHCNLFILSSVSEGFPNSLVEAMACYVPIISVDCKTGPREILMKDVRNNSLEIEYPFYAEYGILIQPFQKIGSYEPKKEEMLVETIKEMMINTEKREYYKKKARERASMFRRECYAEKIIYIIERV